MRHETIGPYAIKKVISTEGGMGDVYLGELEGKLYAIKICKVDASAEMIHRFEREIRLLKSLNKADNVVKIRNDGEHKGLPYYVMTYYPMGCLSNVASDVRSKSDVLERTMTEMAQCLHTLHSQGKFHRDVKPSNFLVKRDGTIKISDFGAGIDMNLQSSFTGTQQFIGTFIYSPPEYQSGGSHRATAEGDIYMLGKSFYFLITGEIPTHIATNRIPSHFRHLIDRCCKPDPSERFSSIDQVLSEVKLSFDILLNRGGDEAVIKEHVVAFNDSVSASTKIDFEVVESIMAEISKMDAEEAEIHIDKLNPSFFKEAARERVKHLADAFIGKYKEIAESGNHSWSYAETIADNMMAFIENCSDNKMKAEALEAAIISATRLNRWAAMETVTNWIESVSDADVASEVIPIILNQRNTFVRNIDKNKCQSQAIYNVIAKIEPKDE